MILIAWYRWILDLFGSMDRYTIRPGENCADEDDDRIDRIGQQDQTSTNHAPNGQLKTSWRLLVNCVSCLRSENKAYWRVHTRWIAIPVVAWGCLNPIPAIPHLPREIAVLHCFATVPAIVNIDSELMPQQLHYHNASRIGRRQAEPNALRGCFRGFNEGLQWGASICLAMPAMLRKKTPWLISRRNHAEPVDLPSGAPWQPGDRHPNVLILVPTLELGVQVTLVAQQIAQARGGWDSGIPCSWEYAVDIWLYKILWNIIYYVYLH